MKLRNLIGLTIFSLIIVLGACKKEDESIKEPELELSNNYSEETRLTTSNPDLDITGRVAPEDVSNMEITIRITSNADPDGIEVIRNLQSGSYTEGKVRYNYLSFFDQIHVANHTDESKRRIKVSELGDTLRVIVGDNIIEKTYVFNADEQISYHYFANDFAGRVRLDGYTYDGTENKQIEVWSTRDSQKVPINGKYRNPEDYQGLWNFDSYGFWIPFNNGWSYPADTIVGIYPISDLDPDGDTVFIKYNEVTYFTPYFETARVLRVYNN